MNRRNQALFSVPFVLEEKLSLLNTSGMPEEGGAISSKVKTQANGFTEDKIIKINEVDLLW